MRHIMVWFSCSAVDCEAKAERLVAVRIGQPDRRAVLDRDQLPEGWGSLPDSDVASHDRERTFCYEHAKRVTAIGERKAGT